MTEKIKRWANETQGASGVDERGEPWIRRSYTLRDGKRLRILLTNGVSGDLPVRVIQGIIHELSKSEHGDPCGGGGLEVIAS